jgi:hypothetical protein
MKHIRKFESYSNKRKLQEIIKESVMIVDDIYRVNVTADIPQSLLNAYIKKVKDSLDKNARQFYSDVQLAEEITKHVLQQGLNIDKIDPSALFGGQPQGQAQPAQVQAQAPVQAQAQAPVQAQPQVQVDAQAPVQGLSDGCREQLFRRHPRPWKTAQPFLQSCH